MFTGIVEAIGRVRANETQAGGTSRRLVIDAPFAASLTLGESVSVNGTCLTVVQITDRAFHADVSPTTLQLTTLGDLHPTRHVNLERSVTPATRLGGHWVLGHVDTQGRVASIQVEGDVHHIDIHYPEEYSRWVLPQGSLTLDGISLTIVERSDQHIKVTIIPHTWDHTIIHDWTVNTPINMEFDVLGKYVEHLLAPYSREEQA